jgi:hypothetical protein
VAEDHPGPDLICARCNGAHTILACPHVKAVEFQDGYYEGEEQPRISRIEFLTPADYGPAPAAGENKLPDYQTLGGPADGANIKNR